MNRPFEILEQWVRQGRIHLAAVPALDAPSGETESPNGETRDFSVETLPAGLSDDELFEYAMKDVRSLGWSAGPLHKRPPMEIQAQDDEQDALPAFDKFVRDDNVAFKQTAEYIEGS